MLEFAQSNLQATPRYKIRIAENHGGFANSQLFSNPVEKITIEQAGTENAFLGKCSKLNGFFKFSLGSSNTATFSYTLTANETWFKSQIFLIAYIPMLLQKYLFFKLFKENFDLLIDKNYPIY